MSDIQNRVKAIIVDKLGVDESEVKPEDLRCHLRFHPLCSD